MAFIQDEDDKKKDNDSEVIASQGANITPQGQSQAPQAPGTTTNPAIQQPSQRRAGSGRFQNLQRFIQANTGAGQRLGQQLGGNIQQRGQQLGTLIGQQQGNIQQQAQQETQRLNQASPFIQQAVTNPLQTTQNQEQLQRFANLRQNVLNVPQIAAQPEIQQQLQNLSTTAQQTGSEAGRLGLLRQTFNLPGYSRGASRLDQLLLQSSPEALQQLGQTGREQAGQRQEQFGGVQEEQGQLAEQIQQLGQERASEAMEAVTGAKEERTGTLGERAEERRTSFENTREGIARKLRRGDQLSPEDFDFMGVPAESRGQLNEMISARSSEKEMDEVTIIDSKGDRRTVSADEARRMGVTGIDQKLEGGDAVEKIKYRYLPKLDFSSHLSAFDPAAFTQESVATTDELAKLNALQQLAGAQDRFRSELAGTAPEQAGFNFQGAIDQGKSALGPQYTPGSYQASSPYAEEESSLGFINDILAPVGKILDPVGGIINKVISPVTSVFCFRPDTLVTMEDGSKKKIKDIKVRDNVALGGMVCGIGEALNADIYNKDGVEVSANHAFFNNGKWARVSEDNAEYIGDGELQSVYMIWTRSHLLEINGTIWADNAEIDDYAGLTEEELLDILNSDDIRNKKLSQVEESLNGKEPAA